MQSVIMRKNAKVLLVKPPAVARIVDWASCHDEVCAKRSQPFGAGNVIHQVFTVCLIALFYLRAVKHVVFIKRLLLMKTDV